MASLGGDVLGIIGSQVLEDQAYGVDTYAVLPRSIRRQLMGVTKQYLMDGLAGTLGKSLAESQPYKSAGLSILAVVGNESQWTFAPIGAPLPRSTYGRLMPDESVANCRSGFASTDGSIRMFMTERLKGASTRRNYASRRPARKTHNFHRDDKFF